MAQTLSASAGSTRPAASTHGSTGSGAPGAPDAPMTTQQKRAALAQLATQIAACTRCPLAKGRTRTVPGEGNPDAKIMFIGEAPGFHEDQQGRPFVGAAGQLLEELLASIGLRRQDVYIANVIKCRPPNNRDPEPAEIAACDPYLEQQIRIIRPRIIVTLGRFSMAKFFPGEKISRIHGQPRRRNGVIYFPMYHPAAALHQSSLRRFLEEDIKKLPALLAEAERQSPAPAAEPPKQETLVQGRLF
jgi:uracil-DNA glycosylase family 4